jgi:hypothetical protein
MLGKKHARPEPLYVFGAAGATSDNRKTEPRGAFKAPSLRDSPSSSARSLQKKGIKSRKIGVRLLTRTAIYGLASGVSANVGHPLRNRQE